MWLNPVIISVDAALIITNYHSIYFTSGLWVIVSLSTLDINALIQRSCPYSEPMLQIVHKYFFPF